MSAGTSGKDVESEKVNQIVDSHYRINSINKVQLHGAEENDVTFLCVYISLQLTFLILDAVIWKNHRS